VSTPRLSTISAAMFGIDGALIATGVHRKR
jgi:hypothetical protein